MRVCSHSLHRVYRKLSFSRLLPLRSDLSSVAQQWILRSCHARRYDLTAFHMYPTTPKSPMILQAAWLLHPSSSRSSLTDSRHHNQRSVYLFTHLQQLIGTWSSQCNPSLQQNLDFFNARCLSNETFILNNLITSFNLDFFYSDRDPAKV